MFIRIFVIALLTEHSRYTAFVKHLAADHVRITATKGKGDGCVRIKASACSKIRGIIDTHASFVRSAAATAVLHANEAYVFAEVDARPLPHWKTKLQRLQATMTADVLLVGLQPANVCSGATALLVKNLSVHRALVSMFTKKPYDDIDCLMFRRPQPLLRIEISAVPVFYASSDI